MSDIWRERLNLFYYNIFRFECFTQYLISYPLYQIARFTGLERLLAKRLDEKDWDLYILSVLNDPKGGISLHIAGVQVTILIGFLFLSPWNIFCGLMQFGIRTLWPYGAVASLVLSVLISYYVAPVDRREYLKNFKEFEAMPKAEKRKFALLTFLIVAGIWSLFISSFVFYIRSLIR